jgi:hypothetical protein
MEGSSPGPCLELSWHLPEGTEKNNGKSVVLTAVRAEIWNQYLQNECC